MKLRTIGPIAGLLTLSMNCDYDPEPPGPPPEDETECTADIGLIAFAAEQAGSEVTVYGQTAPPPGVTVHAIFVGGAEVPHTTFNFRAWSVEIAGERLRSLTRDEIARIPIVAFASSGCQRLSDSEMPVVRILDEDSGAETRSVGDEDDTPDTGPGG